MINEYAQSIRRELHMYPEIGFDLPRTLSLIRRELDKIGLPYTEEYGKSSIVATLNEEKKSHYCIGIRADIDALPILEANDVPYKSKIDGAMHACGHDAHCAMLLTAAKKLKEEADKIDCCVKFLFQPAEEYPPSGAKLMAEDGVLDDVDTVIALHVNPHDPVGKIGISSGMQGAISHGFFLEFYGKASHAANQDTGIDAIMMAVKAYTAMEFMISKEVSYKKVIVFNVGTIHGGTTNNVVCDKCVMHCTLRTREEETDKLIIRRIKEICEGTALSSGGQFKFVESKYYPNVINDESVCEKIRLAAESVVGKENVIGHKPGMGGEDFSYFSNLKPGAMFRLGVRNEAEGIVNGAHHDNFDIDENALDIGAKVFVKFVEQNMNG